MARALGLLAVLVAVFVALERGPAVELVVTAAFFVRVAGALAAGFVPVAPARVDVVGDGFPAAAVREAVRTVEPDALVVAAFPAGVAFFAVVFFAAAFFAVTLVVVVAAVCFAVVLLAAVFFAVVFFVGAACRSADRAVDATFLGVATFVAGAALFLAVVFLVVVFAAVVFAAVVFLAVVFLAVVFAAVVFAVADFVAVVFVAVVFVPVVLVAALPADAFAGVDFAAVLVAALAVLAAALAVWDAGACVVFFAEDDFLAAALVDAVVAPAALVALRPAARATTPFTAPAALAAVRATAVRALPPFADAAPPAFFDEIRFATPFCAALFVALFVALLLVAGVVPETFRAAAVFVGALVAAAAFVVGALVVAGAGRFEPFAFVVALAAAPVLVVAVERVAAVAAAVVFFAAIRSSVARAVDADKWG